jgi:hypothetical protein
VHGKWVHTQSTHTQSTNVPTGKARKRTAADVGSSRSPRELCGDAGKEESARGATDACHSGKNSRIADELMRVAHSAGRLWSNRGTVRVFLAGKGKILGPALKAVYAWVARNRDSRARR